MLGKDGLSRRALLAAGSLGALAAPVRAAEPYRRLLADVAISADDIAWFRRCRSLWVESESGAPAIFGPGLSPENIGTIPSEDYVAYETRMEPILCAFFLHAPFAPGTYHFAQPLDGKAEVEVTADDLTLLRQTSWRHFAIDGKRPYGDFTNYPIDMARALGIPVTRNQEGYDEIPPETDARMVALHRTSQFVLQAYLEHAELAPGQWFIPEDGWDLLISPRCQPVTPAAIAAYRVATTRIALRAATEASGELIPPRFEASIALFASK